VCVRQRREHPHAELAQLGHPLGLGAAIADRPRPADQRPRLVEVGPDPALHPLGQEMGVHVGQARQAQPGAEVGHSPIISYVTF
jgi:hypothetical protein